MSLSDNYAEEFKPFDVTALENFDDEKSGRTEDTPADFERFKMLFEKPVFDPSSSDGFSPLYEAPKQVAEVFFSPLIEGDSKNSKQDDQACEQPVPPEKADGETAQESAGPEESPEEKGFALGYDSGFIEGMGQGVEQGQKKGFEKGYDKGLADGESKGLELGKANGYEQGYEQGRQAGEESAKQQASVIIQSLQDSMTAIDNTLPDLIQKYEVRIMALIQRICEKVVMAAVEADDEAVQPMIMDALKALVNPEEIELTVSQEDYEYIEMVKDDFFEQVDTLQHISVRSDPVLPRGGCKIQTSTASIQTDPQTRLAAIFEAIKQVKRTGVR